MRIVTGRNSLWFAVLLWLSAALVCGCGAPQAPEKTARNGKSPPAAERKLTGEAPQLAGDARGSGSGQPADSTSPGTPATKAPDRPGAHSGDAPGAQQAAATQQTPQSQQPPIASAKPGEAPPSAESEMPGEPAAETGAATEGAEQGAEQDKPEDLQPLIDKPEDLQRLDPVKPLWFDKAHRRVVMVGRVVQNNVPLELFACIKNTKEHEAILSVDVKAFAVHAALVAAGAKPGRPARWDPEYTPPTGSEIEITVVWKGPDGKLHTARAQDWVYDLRKEAPMRYPWVFAGSGFFEDPDSGNKYYLAEAGEFICLSNFPGAMLDVPIESTDADASLMFQANKQRIPARGTPVTIILTPKIERNSNSPKDGAADTPKPPDPPKAPDVP